MLLEVLELVWWLWRYVRHRGVTVRSHTGGEGGQAGRLRWRERRGCLGFHTMILHFTEWHFERLPRKNPAAVSPPPTLRFKALAFISQTDEWHSPRLLCVWIVSIPILRNDQTKGTHWEKRLTAVKIFSFFISIMVPKWCFGADSSTQTHTSTQTRTRTLWIPRFSPHSSSSC